jgi:hypothetical protein
MPNLLFAAAARQRELSIIQTNEKSCHCNHSELANFEFVSQDKWRNSLPISTSTA